MRVASGMLGLAVTFLMMITAFANAGEIEGLWIRGDGNARVRIEPCGSKICAVNTWIRDEKEQHEHVGDVLIFNVRATENGYSGTAHDPQRNLELSAHLQLVGDSLTSRGCILAGLWCRRMHWTRTK